MFSEPLAIAVAYLAEVSVMPSIISGSLLRTAHWVVSSSCTSSDEPVNLCAMDVNVLLQPASTNSARTAASAKSNDPFCFLHGLCSSKIAEKCTFRKRYTDIVYRIFFPAYKGHLVRSVGRWSASGNFHKIAGKRLDTKMRKTVDKLTETRCNKSDAF